MTQVTSSAITAVEDFCSQLYNKYTNL